MLKLYKTEISYIKLIYRSSKSGRIVIARSVQTFMGGGNKVLQRILSNFQENEGFYDTSLQNSPTPFKYEPGLPANRKKLCLLNKSKWRTKQNKAANF